MLLLTELAAVVPYALPGPAGTGAALGAAPAGAVGAEQRRGAAIEVHEAVPLVQRAVGVAAARHLALRVAPHLHHVPVLVGKYLRTQAGQDERLDEAAANLDD